MTAETAYQFLQAPLEQMSPEERKRLCELISGRPEPKPQKRKKPDPVPTVVDYKKKLLKTIFKK